MVPCGMHVLGLVLVAYWREDRVDCSTNKNISYSHTLITLIPKESALHYQ